MAINIIDGFYLGSATPIDTRFVMADTVLRDAIVYKYDGLKVFVISDRVTYTWNAGTSTWDSDMSITGDGQEGFITRWSSSTLLGTSSIYATSSFVGINTIDPLSNLQINGDSQPLSIHNGSSGVIIGYNWYYSAGDQTFTASVGSSTITQDNGSFVFRTADPSNSLQSVLELNNSGYNLLLSPDVGNFIGGSVSFGDGSPDITEQLVHVGGSFRTNGSVYKRVSTLKHYQSGPIFAIDKQSGFGPGVLTPTVDNYYATGSTAGTIYDIDPDDNEIIVQTTTLAQKLVLKLPTIGGVSEVDCNENGREIIINYSSGGTSSEVQSSSIIYDNKGLPVSRVYLNEGDTVRIVSHYDPANDIQAWKVVGFSNNFTGGTYDDFMWHNGTNYTSTNFSNKIFDRVRNYGHIFTKGITFSTDIHAKTKFIVGSGSVIGGSKLSIYDDDSVGGLFITKPGGETVSNNAPVAGAYIYGSTIFSNNLSLGQSILSLGYKSFIENGYGQTSSMRGIYSYNVTNNYDSSIPSYVFMTDVVGLSPSNTYSTQLNYIGASSSLSEWKYLRTLKGATEQFYIDGNGRTKSESLIANKYHNLDTQNQMFYSKTSKSNVIIQLGSDYEVASSGMYQISGYNNYPTNTSDVYGYTLPSSEYGSSLGTFSINSQDFDTAYVYWTRVGQIVNCSFRVSNHRGRLFSSASGLYTIKLPLPVMTDYAFSGVSVVVNGSGNFYWDSALYHVEVSSPSGSDAKKFFHISKTTSSVREVRGNFSYQLG